MNLKNISDSDLLDKTKEVVTKEKFYTHLVLEHLSEVDKRKLYCDLGLSFPKIIGHFSNCELNHNARRNCERKEN